MIRAERDETLSRRSREWVTGRETDTGERQRQRGWRESLREGGRERLERWREGGRERLERSREGGGERLEREIEGWRERGAGEREGEKGRREKVTLCLTPNQPIRLYQGEGRDKIR